MREHWAVFFIKNRLVHLDNVVRANAQEEIIKSRMMKFAECYAVAYHGFSAWLIIRDYMGGI